MVKVAVPFLTSTGVGLPFTYMNTFLVAFLPTTTVTVTLVAGSTVAGAMIVIAGSAFVMLTDPFTSLYS